MQRLVEEIDPTLTALLPPAHAARVLGRAPNAAVVAPTAAASGFRPAWLPFYRGTATSWQNHRDPEASAFVVELPAAALTRARGAAPRATRCSACASAWAPSARRRAKPAIEWDRIPFGEARRAQMRAYSKRHYGSPVARLRDPKVIVEHFTATDVVLLGLEHVRGQRARRRVRRAPGVCAHFVIDRDGTIHQLVPLQLTLPPHRRPQPHARSGSSTSASPTPTSWAAAQLARLAARSRAGCRRATASARATSSGTPRASPARTTTSASPPAHPAHGDFSRRDDAPLPGRL